MQSDIFVYAKEYFHPFNPTPLQYKPLILVGPSGVGKFTLIKEALKKYGNLFELKRSITTRPIRDFEKGKENFQFTTKEEFKKMIDSGLLIEY